MPEKIDTVRFTQPFLPTWLEPNPARSQKLWDEIAGLPHLADPAPLLGQSLPLTMHIAPDAWSAIQDGKGHPEYGPATVTITRADAGASSEISAPPGTPLYNFTIAMPSYYEVVQKKKGFLGGASGGLVGALVGLALAAPTGGASLSWSAAALAAGSGAALGTIAGTGAEAAISGTTFEIGDVLKNAAIAGGVAGVGAGITSSLGPVTTAAGATLPPGVQGPVMAAVTTPGLLSASAANTLGVLSSTITRTALAPFAATSAALSETLAPVARTSAQPLPLSGGAVNTTGSTWFNYANSVDVPAARPVGLFDTVLDSILPPMTDPKLWKNPGNDPYAPYNGGTPNSGTENNGAVAAIVAAVLLIGGAAAFAHVRRNAHV